MMRIFQGMDLVSVAGFERVWERHEGFTEDIFSPLERAHCMSRKNPAIHFAGRFAAKEAAIKALGLRAGASGFLSGFGDIEVRGQGGGKPVLHFRGWAARMAARRGIVQKTVSITHSGNYAAATVILLAEPGPRQGREPKRQ